MNRTPWFGKTPNYGIWFTEFFIDFLGRLPDKLNVSVDRLFDIQRSQR